MQCKKCGYQLWNIHSRNCPECGTAFLLSDYDFSSVSVILSCPHCNHTYNHKDRQSHLDNTPVNCEGCGKAIGMDDMVVRPDESQGQHVEDLVDHPWRTRKGFKDILPAWIRTVFHTFFKPSKLAGRGGTRVGKYEGAKYIILTLFLITFLSLLLYSHQIKYHRLVDPEMWLFEWMDMLAFVLGIPLLLSVCGYLVAMVWGLVAHCLIRMMSHPKGDVSDTVDCFFYTSGVWIVLLFAPLIIVIPIYWIVGIWLLWYLISSRLLCKVHRVPIAVAYSATMAIPLGIFVFLFWGISSFGQN